MTCRLMVTLEPDEADALARLATIEVREPREQARFLVRQELIRLGLLKADREADLLLPSSPTTAEPC